MEQNQAVSTSPKDFFLHISSVIVLYAGILSLLTLVFRLIDAIFPPIGQYAPYTPSISWEVAILIILTPLFLILNWLIERDVRSMPIKRSLGIRKWMTYLTLFLAGGAVVGDLITVLYYFLNGETLTKGFIHKVLAVFVIAALIFWYYVASLRNPEKVAAKNKIWALILIVVILGAIIGGFAITGSPATQQKNRRDDTRLSDLQNLENEISQYWQAKGSLPQNLSSLTDQNFGGYVPVDPQTGKQYEYTPKQGAQFTLCATFESYNPPQGVAYAYPGMSSNNSNWFHGPGHICFDRTVNQQLYPPAKPLPYTNGTGEQRGS